ncbi:MAG: 5-oxoprolinase subunit PxpB [Pseudomonadota bacterium]
MQAESGSGGAPRILPFGDGALIVEYGDRVDRALSAKVLALDAAMTAAPPPGLQETAPSFRSLLVRFDPLETDGAAMEAAIRALLATSAGGGAAQAPRRLWTLPVCHDGELAPDLDAVAERAGLTRSAVIDLHTAMEHHVYMIGFLPGCPYLGDLPAAIDFPRRTDPRLRVPAGSVAIAVGLTVIYPVESPGGWHLIGRCPARLFDIAAEGPPALLSPGDRVRFEPVSAARYAELARAAEAGEWAPGATGAEA